jgi:uncharacterized protein YdhG (YjbR/CyaY superfamily)
MAAVEHSPDVDAYIDSCPAGSRDALREVRRTIHEAVPGAGEKVSYRIATLTLDGRMLCYFAGFERHVSVYPIPPADDELQRAMAPYVAGKGTLRFSLDQEIPSALVARVAQAHAARVRG